MALAPSYGAHGTSAAAPIHRIRLTATEVATDRVVGSALVETDPNAEAWELTLRVEVPSSQAIDILVDVELINLDGAEESVEWSGQAGPLRIGGGGQATAGVQLYRGPLGNLAITSITIGNAPEDMVQDETAQLSATAAGVTSATIFWGSLDPGTAVVSPDGLVQALLPGTARIVAAGGPRADTAVIVVLALADAVAVEPATVQLAYVGAEAAFAAVVLDGRGDPAPDLAVEWSVSDEALAEHLGDGLFRVLAPGVVDVIATVPDGGPSGSASLSLVQVPAAVAIEPAAGTVLVDQSLALAAVVSDSGGATIGDAAVAWTSADPATATVDDGGVVTGIAAGSVFIRASSGEAIDSAEVTVERLPGPPDALLLTSGDAQSGTVGEPLAEQLVVRVVDIDGIGVPSVLVEWSVTGDGIADPAADLTDADGFGRTSVTLPTTAGAGSVTAVVDGPEPVGFTFDAVAGAPTQVVASTDTLFFAAFDENEQLDAEAFDQYGNPALALFNWTFVDTGDGAVAIVSGTGLVTAIANGAGAAVVEAAGATDTVVVIVQQQAASLAVSPVEGAAILGDTLRFAATVEDANGHPLDAEVVWEVTDPELAAVDSDGLVTALRIGTVEVVAAAGTVADTAFLDIVLPDGVTMYWLGDTDDLWTGGTNWSGVATPTETDILYIPRTASIQPRLPALSQGLAGGLIVQDGAQLTLDDPSTLLLFGDLDAGNSIVGGGVVEVSETGVSLSGQVSNLRIQDGLTAHVAPGGRLDVTGTLEVFGQLELNGRTVTVGTSLDVFTAGAAVVMLQPTDTLIVAGDASFNGSGTTGLLEAGVLEVVGDLAIGQSFGPDPFQAGGTHQTILRGAGTRVLSPMFSVSGVRFQNLEIAQGPVLVSGAGSALPVGGTLRLADAAAALQGPDPIRLDSAQLVMAPGSSLTLSQLQVVLSDLSIADANFSPVTVSFSGDGQLIPAGDAYQNIQTFDSVVVAGPVRASGALTVFDGVVDLNGNTVELALDLSTFAGGTIRMVQEADTLRVGGTANFAGGVTFGRLTHGVLEVASLVSSTLDTYDPSGFHVTRFVSDGDVTLALPAEAAFQFLEIAIADGAFARPTGFLMTNENLVVQSGTLDLNSSTVHVGNVFITEGTGRLSMAAEDDFLNVAGSAFFRGGSTAELLTLGIIEIDGGFVQSANPEAFAASPGLMTRFQRSGSAIEFEHPGRGPGTSHFGDLWLESDGTSHFRLVSDVSVTGALMRFDFGEETADTIVGNGNTMDVRIVDVRGLVFDDAPLVIDGETEQTIFVFERVSFQNMNPEAVQLRVVQPGGEHLLWNVRFLTEPTTGFYIHALGPFNLLMVEPFPEERPGEFLREEGGGVITWPHVP